MTHAVEIVSYNLNWPSLFEEEALKIKNALGSNCIAIHHIGSTSVPNLSAKPIIDIMPIVVDINKVDESNKKMENLGYQVKGEYFIPFRRHFTKENEQKGRTLNIHAFEQFNQEIDRHLKFRNWLITHHEDRIEYEKLKQHLAKEFPSDISSYTIGKNKFINEIVEKAGFNGFRIFTAISPEELKAYHRIRKEQIFDKNGNLYNPNHFSITAENTRNMLLYKGKHIVTIAMIEILNNNEAALRSLATDQKYQGNGYGSYFLTQLEKWLKCQGIKILKLHSNMKAVEFYRKQNYINMEFKDKSILKEYVDLGKIL